MKFAVLKFKHILQISLWRFWFFSNEVPGGTSQNRGGLAQRFPARRVTGGEGKVGENDEELESYLWVVVGGAEVVRSGGSTERGGRRRVCSGVVVLQRRKEGAAGLGRFIGSRVIRSGGWFGERVAGEGGSAASRARQPWQ